MLGILLQGDRIEIQSHTRRLWHEFHQNYAVDPMMDTTPYTYEFERMDRAYDAREKDETKRYFVILQKGTVIGQIYLKRINRQEKSTEFGIALIHDSVKGRGYGTESSRLLLDYAFHTMGVETVLADSVLRNTKSQHMLEKLGFLLTHEDSDFKYYRMRKSESACLR